MAQYYFRVRHGSQSTQDNEDQSDHIQSPTKEIHDISEEVIDKSTTALIAPSSLVSVEVINTTTEEQGTWCHQLKEVPLMEINKFQAVDMEDLLMVAINKINTNFHHKIEALQKKLMDDV